MPHAEFEQRLEALLTEVKSASPIEPDQPVMLPGELEHARMAQRMSHGIPIDLETVKRLRRLAQDLRVLSPF